MSLAHLKRPRAIFAISLLALCAFMPPMAAVLDAPFYTDLFARMMISAIAAVSLNLILGYGGMISFGHAVFLGIGGYTVGILAYHGIESAWVQWPLALGVSALVGLVFGAISLRTRGVYFIMITMALTQMVYYLAVSAEEYGSDDGLVIYARSGFGTEFYDLNKPLHLYYTIFAVLLLSLLVSWRITESRFGMVITGARSNEVRMQAIGFPTYRYRLTCFVIAGVMCGMAGILSANREDFVSPDLMHWMNSGELIFMVVLGGMGSLFGPLAGALAYKLLSEFLSRLTENWHLIFGPFLVLVVLFARGGIYGLVKWWEDRHG